MQSESPEPFPDNWTYLKAELNWLDRVLSLAVARQRKETKEVERLARTRADRATSHWWKGLMSLDGEASYDSPAEMPRRRGTRNGYQQQMEAKILASEQRGICLGLPSLRRQLQLSVFEKNLVLMALAPEISRRYGQIYNYLQETEFPGASGLPTVDLLLRILCRNDAEWRMARQYLVEGSVLLQYQLLEVRSRVALDNRASPPEPFLSRLVKLSDSLVSYLLADQPDEAFLKSLLQPNRVIDLIPAESEQPYFFAPSSLPSQSSPQSSPPLLSPLLPPAHLSWSNLILPAPLMEDLQHLCHSIQYGSQVDVALGFQELAAPFLPPQGTMVLLIGAAGTGKTTAALAIAQTLRTPLFWIDLALLNPADHPRLLQELMGQSPTLSLLKSAQVWLGHPSPLSATEIHQFLDWRHRHRGITLLSITHKQTVKTQWRQQMSRMLEFPMPDEASRLRLWQQAFPAQLPLDAAIDWKYLSQRFRLSGGEICAIAREAAFYAVAESSNPQLGMRHLLKAIQAKQSGKGRKLSVFTAGAGDRSDH